MSKAAELAKMGEVLTNGQVGGRRNLIINGGMQVAQRGTSVSGLGSSATYFTLDRWCLGINGTTAGRFTMSQSTDTPNGFSNSMKIDITTTDTSISSSESVGVLQRIEGFNVQSLAKGTSAAKKSTFSFYAKGTAKTFIVEFQDDNSRRFSRTFTTTTSWQRFTIDIPADTTGEIDNDNTTGLTIIFWFHAGSDYTSGTLQTTWGGTTNANRMVGCESLFDSTDNELYITGVQLEVGSVATPFEHRTKAQEELDCFRYFYTEEGVMSVYSTYYSSGKGIGNYRWKVPMRAAPTITIVAQSGGMTANGSTVQGFYAYHNTATNADYLQFKADAEL